MSELKTPYRLCHITALLLVRSPQPVRRRDLMFREEVQHCTRVLLAAIAIIHLVLHTPLVTVHRNIVPRRKTHRKVLNCTPQPRLVDIDR